MTDEQLEAQEVTGSFKLEERTADVAVSQLAAMSGGARRAGGHGGERAGS